MSDTRPGDDPLYDRELWSFSAWFPPPYRVLMLASLGLILFSINVLVLHRKGIDLFALFRADAAEKKRLQPAHYHRIALEDELHHTATSSSSDGILPTAHASAPTSPHLGGTQSRTTSGLTTRPLFVFGLFQLTWSVLGWFSYRFYVDRMEGDPRGRHAQALQGFAVSGAFLALLWPGNLFFKSMRKAFGRSVLLILSPSLSQTVTFSDVILADIFTSFARVFGDVWLTACFLLPRKEHHTWWNGKGSAFVPILISLPYLIRFRQCISEYRTSMSTDKGRKSKKPLWNAAKYASAFPVIWLSAWYEADKKPHGPQIEIFTRYTLWILSVFVNSLFSFWWDVSNDWGLSILQPSNFSSTSAFAESAGSLHRRGVSYMPLPSGGDMPPFPQNGFAAVAEKASAHLNAVSGGLASSSSSTNSQLFVPHPRASNSSSSSSSSVGSSASGSVINGSAVAPGAQLQAPHQTHTRTLSTVERILRPAPSLLFPIFFYQLAIVLDLLLRFFWSLKLSSHLHHLMQWQGGLFVMELLEIFRRWVWVFFRVEWEIVKRRELARTHVAID
ncbi:EXS-domain-containing protein [Testicularia cyperi]|uniref:EXS-domain-containing protein n=1 Tax=Testicularia cyperi TaxID=1882483 RepID=A0A317Y0A9_9BASI|nr:EXS-domain-containing protein [Testicularia cyperi]